MAIGTPVCIGLRNQTTPTPPANNVVTTTATVPAGALVVVLLSWIDNDGSQTYSAMSGGGLTWAKDAELELANSIHGTTHGFAAFSAPAPAGVSSGTNFTATESGKEWGVNIAAYYVEGVSLEADRLDGSQMGETEGNVTGWTTGSGTVTAADAILLAQNVNDGADSAGDTVDAPATKITGSENYDSSFNDWGSVGAYQIVSSTGSYAITGNAADTHNFGGSAGWVAYKVAEEGEPSSAPTLNTVVTSGMRLG